MKTKKKLFVAIISLIMLFTSLYVFPMQVSATQGVPVSSLTSGKTYFIRNYRSGLYMDVDNGGGVNTQVIQWRLNRGECQQWRLTNYGSYYSLSPVHRSNTHYLNLYNAKTADGTPIVIWDTFGAPDSYSSWYINSEGYDNHGRTLFSIKAYNASNKAAVIENGSYDGEASVILLPYNGASNQLWYFEEVSETEDDPIYTLKSCSTYFIRNYNSGLYMDVYCGGGVGTQVIQANFNQATCQQWRLTFYDGSGYGGYYSLSPVHLTSTNYLNLYNAQTANGTLIKIWDMYGAPDSYSSWYINFEGYGSQNKKLFSIRAYNAPSKAAVIENGNVTLEPYSGASNQLWYFEEIAEMDGQNKTHWCWATCAAHLARYNKDHYNGSLIAHNANEVLTNTDGIKYNYIGYVNGAPAAYGLQRQAVMHCFSNIDGNYDSPTETEDLRTCVDYLSNNPINTTRIDCDSDYNWATDSVNIIKTRLFYRPVWLITMKSTDEGHSLLAKSYNSSTNEILVWDPYYMQSYPVSATSMFNGSGFTLPWREETFRVYGAGYIQ